MALVASRGLLYARIFSLDAVPFDGGGTALMRLTLLSSGEGGILPPEVYKSVLDHLDTLMVRNSP